MGVITFYENSKLSVQGLSSKWVEGFSRLASFTNEEKIKAVKEMVYGAKHMDDLLTLADVDEQYLHLPRGLKTKLVKLLEESQYEYEFIDQTSYAKKPIDISDAPILTEEQRPAVRAILKHQSGRIIMPTGSGKTVVALSAIANIKRPTLILVDKLHIANQWRDRAWEHIGYNPGIIGDKQWVEKPVCVALLQTLHSRRDEIDDEWWSKWSVVIHDEQHHIPAETYQEIVQRFPAKYRIGMSATIGKSKAKKKISELVFGPIIYEFKEQKIKPEIKVIETSFTFDYEPTQEIGGRVIRNNYQALVKALIEDDARNNLIADTIVKEQDQANLITSRRLNHLYELRQRVIDLGFPEERCWMLTGKESTEERMEIYKMANEANCAIFSTVADEALDIPRLDRLYLVFPEKNEEGIKQKVGRLTRAHPNKETCLVYDFVDSEIGIIKNQFGHRLRNFYQKEQLTVYKITG
jgi:superfamily II DNA or RNA helicase